MNKEEIIKEIATKFNLDENNIKEESRFVEDLNLDSIDLVETLMDIEEEHQIQIPDEKVVEIKTIGEFVQVILEEKNE